MLLLCYCFVSYPLVISHPPCSELVVCSLRIPSKYQHYTGSVGVTHSFRWWYIEMQRWSEGVQGVDIYHVWWCWRGFLSCSDLSTGEDFHSGADEVQWPCTGEVVKLHANSNAVLLGIRQSVVRWIVDPWHYQSTSINNIWCLRWWVAIWSEQVLHNYTSSKTGMIIPFTTSCISTWEKCWFLVWGWMKCRKSDSPIKLRKICIQVHVYWCLFSLVYFGQNCSYQK